MKTLLKDGLETSKIECVNTIWIGNDSAAQDLDHFDAEANETAHQMNKLHVRL